MEVLIVYYSMYGHIYRMAEAVKEGAGSVSGTDVQICRVPETLPDDVLEKMGALKTQKSLAHVPVCKVNDLAAADAIIFGTPTRFGNMCGLCLCRPHAHRRDHGGSPYGASTISGGDGTRLPSENELAAARYQGKHVAEIAVKLSR